MLGGKYLQMIIFLSVLSIARGSRISISPDGGYNDIVIKIKQSVPEDSCQQILAGIKVTFLKQIPIYEMKFIERKKHSDVKYFQKNFSLCYFCKPIYHIQITF